MLNVVVDTNVIISAALSPKGNAARIIRFIVNHEAIQMFHNEEILLEYEEVLSRKHLGIPSQEQAAYLQVMKDIGHTFLPVPSGVPLPDESDRIFYDTTTQAKALLITGNKKHYPVEKNILSPAEFLQLLRNANFL